MRLDVWPTKATFTANEPVGLVATCPTASRAEVRVTHLGLLHHEQKVDLPAGRSTVALPPFPIGGYHLELQLGDTTAATAFDVLADQMARPRYGFVSDFPAGRDDVHSVADTLRQLHLNVVQFYDWMYRHHDLIPPGETYDDALGRELSRTTVEGLIAKVIEVGALPIAYGAVYGAGFDYADQHPRQRLYRHDTTPWSLGDLLAIMNIAAGSSWSDHIIGEFARSIDELGFAGIHLDQYGDPKTALDGDGNIVDLAEAFPDFIARTRSRLSDAALIFNNVNDYPTWTTADAPQDATYIEVWSPHDTYADLASLVENARLRAPDRPVILAAYLEPFAEPNEEQAAAAAQLALATVFAHGGHYLLCGENRGVLTHPYYPNYATVSDRTLAVLRDHFDLAVSLGDLLYDPRAEDVTKAVFAGVNHDIEVVGAARVTPDAHPDAIWVTVNRSPDWTTVHLIDLAGQPDTRWNTPKRPIPERSGLRLRLLEPSSAKDDWVLARPGHVPARVTPGREGEYLTADLPPFEGWMVAAVPRRSS